MPELPEVETIRRDLDAELPGRAIRAVRVHHDDLILGGLDPSGFRAATGGRWIGRIGRRAKFLLFPLYAGGPGGPKSRFESLVRVQLRMTGRFWLGDGTPDPTKYRHPGIELDLDDGRTLFYDDVRRLGGFDVLTPAEWSALDGRLGPEPLERGFGPAALAGRLAGSRAPIKNALLDQRRLAGLGNIYASEALHRARIDPGRPAGSLGLDETRRLHRAIRGVLREALDRAGTTLRDYRAVNGRSGSFQTRLRVYARADEPCRRCRTPIRRIVQAGRSTFYCPDCQR